MKYGVMVFLIVSFLLCSFAQAATYYVDFENGLDSNSGLSPTTAWKHSPGDSNAGGNARRTLQAGDTVLFKGGVKYAGNLNINASGTEGNPITFKGDGWPGLEGAKAIFDGFAVAPINVEYRNYVTIEGFKLQNIAGSGISVTGGTGHIIRNNELADITGTGRGTIESVYAADVVIDGNYIHDISNIRGIYADSKDHRIIVKNNIIKNVDYGPGMRFDADRGDVVIVNNEIYNLAGGHINAIATYADVYVPSDFVHSVLIAGNRIINSVRPYALYQTMEVVVYNNVFCAAYGDAGTAPISTWSWEGVFPADYNMIVLNNVLLSSHQQGYTIENQDVIHNLVMKNNIISRPVYEPIGTTDISHNVYSYQAPSLGTNEIYEPDLTKIFASYDGNIHNIDNDYHLKPGSAAIDTGTDITAILNELQQKYGEYYDFFQDKDGDPRPQGAGWDMGAYEYPGVIDTEPPTVPQNLSAQAVSDTQINLTWDASTDNIGVSGYKIYRDGSIIATSSNTSYSDTGLSPSSSYTYQVAAYDRSANESDLSASVSATTLADTTPPSIVSVTAQETSVNITFNEPLYKESAEDRENYSIDNNEILINLASLGPDLMTVTLVTSPHTDNEAHTLAVENVEDVSRNPMPRTEIEYIYRADITDGLVAHWKLDEAAGSLAYDSSGNNHTGTLVNGPAWTEGRIDYALDFDGSNDKVTIPHHDDLVAESITLAAWVYLKQSKTWSAILSKDEQVSYWLGVGGATPLFLLSPDGSSGSQVRFWADSAIALNNWHFIAATYDGNYVQLYIDGSPSGGPQGYNGGIYQGTSQVLIGGSIMWESYSNTFNGIIDDVRIYNRALSPEEILAIYNAAPLPQYTFDSSLQGWHFEPIGGSNFTGALSGWSGGRLSISSAHDTTNRVGLWIGPVEIPCVLGNVYRARFLVSSSQAVGSANPQFRMRWNQYQSLQSASQVVNASGSCSNSLPTDPTQREYNIYFAPILSGNLGVAFDMLDFSASQYGSFYVDSVTVERFSHPGPGTAVKTYTSSTDFSNWRFVTNVGYGPVTSGGAGTETLSITSGMDNSSNSGWWQSSGTANELTYVPDKLYRATYTLRCATDAARNTMPQVRLRCQNEDAQVTQTMELNSRGTGPGAMPEVGGTNYELYFETPTLPGSPGTNEDGFIVTIDMLDFDSAKGGTIYLDSVAVDYVTIP